MKSPYKSASIIVKKYANWVSPCIPPFSKKKRNHVKRFLIAFKRYRFNEAKNCNPWQEFCARLCGAVTDAVLCVSIGNYMFIETSYPRKRGDRARFESEIFPPTPSNGRCMSFWYHMKGGHIGTLNVYMRIYGQSETKLWSMSLDQGDRWNSAVVPILSGNRYYQV